MQPEVVTSHVEGLLRASASELAHRGGIAEDQQRSHTEMAQVHANALVELHGAVVLPDVRSGGTLGPIKTFVRKVIRKLTWWYVEPRWQVQARLDAHSAHLASAVINEFKRIDIELAGDETATADQQMRLAVQIGACFEHIAEVSGQLDLLRCESVGLVNQVAALDAMSAERHEALGSRVEDQGALALTRFDVLDGKVDGVWTEQLARLRDRVDVMDRLRDTLQQDFEALRHQVRAVTPSPPGVSEGELFHLTELAETRATASRKRPVRDLLQWLPDADSGVVVDLGCGRGGLLDVLRANGYQAVGVDSDELMVAACKRRDLACEQGEAVQFLQAQNDKAVAAVFGMLVLEYLTGAEIEYLFETAHQKLAHNGVLMVEGIDPRSGGFPDMFYIDPSRKSVIHPERAGHLCEQIGFSAVAVHVLDAEAPFYLLVATK